MKIVDTSEPLIDLVRACCVKIKMAKGGHGSGFFVAPGTVLTCAHVVGQAKTVQIFWQGHPFSAQVLSIHAQVHPDLGFSYPDLALLHIEQLENHPCVWFDESIHLNDQLYSFGYPDKFPSGDSAMFTYEGPTGEHALLLRLKRGQGRPGQSGAPLLNLRTQKVSGLLKRSLDTESDLGARAIPVQAILQAFPELRVQQEAFHASDSRWRSCMFSPFSIERSVQYTSPLQRPRRAEHFTDRAEEQQWLLDRLQPGKIVTLCGPGGMGKTALVAEVLWKLAPGDSPPELFPDGIVFHSFYGQPEVAIALEQLARTFGEDPLPTPMQAAQRALSGKHVLLVLDGAEEAENLERVLAVCATCVVLVTSRRRSDAADPGLLLDLQRLSLSDAVEVVRAWQVQHQAPVAVIEHICQRVGGLPLALRLVGSYLALHQDEAEDYLAWLEEDVWQALDQGNTSHKSVPMLLARSVARVSAEAQAALNVIGRLALAPFARELVTDVLDVTERVARQALLELVDYGLLVQLGPAYEVSHPLIHTYARKLLVERSDVARQDALVVRLMTVLMAHFPEEVELATWEDCERLVPHIQACATQLVTQQKGLAEAASLFMQAGAYLLQRGRYEQAEDLYARAVMIREQVREPQHTDLASSLEQLATIYHYRGHYKQAEPLFQRALAIKEKTLGPEHPQTATATDNLAGLYMMQGLYERAEPLYQRALAIKEKTLGPEDPQTATTLDNLAELYQEQGQYERAEPLYQRALAIKEKTRGPEHPQTATTLDNLAQLYQDQGQYERAEPLYQRALAIKEKTLGSEHPQTAMILNNLALLYREQGRYEQAEPLFQRALAIYEKTLGPEHPEVATAFHNLAQVYREQGQYEQAEPLFQRALAIEEKMLAPESPLTAATLDNLAQVYREQGQYEQAEPLFQRALVIREKTLGSEHPHTAKTLDNLAQLYQKQNQYERAEPLYQRALAIKEETLASEHPQIAATLDNLAQFYQKQGRYEQAEPLYQRALTIYEHVLPSDHPSLIDVLDHYGSLLRAMNRLQEAHVFEQHANTIRGKETPNSTA